MVFTTTPSRPVCLVTSVLPSMVCAAALTSSMLRQSCTPPLPGTSEAPASTLERVSSSTTSAKRPLPRPPAWTWALTTQKFPPSFSAAATASSTVWAASPGGTGTPWRRRAPWPGTREASSQILGIWVDGARSPASGPDRSAGLSQPADGRHGPHGRPILGVAWGPLPVESSGGMGSLAAAPLRRMRPRPPAHRPRRSTPRRPPPSPARSVPRGLRLPPWPPPSPRCGSPAAWTARGP